MHIECKQFFIVFEKIVVRTKKFWWPKPT